MAMADEGGILVGGSHCCEHDGVGDVGEALVEAKKNKISS